VTTTTTTPWTVPVLKQKLLGILASCLQTTTVDLVAELSARGSGMPIDSMDLFDVLPEFWKVTGLKVPTKELRRSTMQSVDAFVAYVATWSKK
jgi:acyl carrier protein